METRIDATIPLPARIKLFQSVYRVGNMQQCADRDRLQKQYEQLSSDFDDARQRIAESIGVTSKQEFVALNHEADRAWEAVQKTRIALHNHIHEHLCHPTEYA
jgi:hypothetical protein